MLINSEKVQKNSPGNKTLSKHNVMVVDRKPDADDINRAIKRIMKEYERRPICEADRYTSQITFQGKAMRIDDALFDSNSIPELIATNSSFAVTDTDMLIIEEANKLLGELINRKQYPRESKKNRL